MDDATDGDDGTLDPRIQIELENLNTATDEINRLEIALDEANTTFRILLNDCTKRLKSKSKSLGSCVEKARPYYEALEVARHAQLECQRAAVHYQRANEIHQAAKETVALAEHRFLSKQHEWQFDNAWQEMLNHATIKVRDAETQKADSGREHHKKAMLFNAAEQKVQQLEQRLHRHIIKSRPYFDEKSLCNDQLAGQKERVEILQAQVSAVKGAYAASLKELERISEEIHSRRSKSKQVDGETEPPCGPREPGVGAEFVPVFCETSVPHDNSSHSNEKCSKEASPMSNEGSLNAEESCVVAPSLESSSEPLSPLKLAKPQSSLPISRSNLTPLPLLENLTQLKNSSSLERLVSHPNSTSSSEVLKKSATAEDDFGKDQGTASGGEEACNLVLLHHLMENYESELDRCDVTSLSGMSVTTGSSAVSEKDENESHIDEELEELREQVREICMESTLVSPQKHEILSIKANSLPGSVVSSRAPSVYQSPTKNSASSYTTMPSAKSCNNLLNKTAESSLSDCIN